MLLDCKLMDERQGLWWALLYRVTGFKRSRARWSRFAKKAAIFPYRADTVKELSDTGIYAHLYQNILI